MPHHRRRSILRLAIPALVLLGPAWVAIGHAQTASAVTVTARSMNCWVDRACARDAATFRPHVGLSCSAYAARADWGDGVRSSARVRTHSGSCGVYSGHIYREGSTKFTVMVTVTRAGRVVGRVRTAAYVFRCPNQEALSGDCKPGH